MAKIMVCDDCGKEGDEVAEITAYKSAYGHLVHTNNNELFRHDLCPGCRCDFYNYVRSYLKRQKL